MRYVVAALSAEDFGHLGAWWCVNVSSWGEMSFLANG